MSTEADRSRVLSTQKDTKTAPVALCQGKLKSQVWNPAWRKEMLGQGHNAEQMMGVSKRLTIWGCSAPVTLGWGGGGLSSVM